MLIAYLVALRIRESSDNHDQRSNGVVAAAVTDLRAYCDESITHDKAPNIFCIAGWVAHASEWRDFDKEWQRALKAEGLIEFKAAQYAGGRGEYGGRGRPDCERVWKRFASILRAMRSVGFATILDLDAYEGLATVFKAKRQPKYHDP